MIHRGSPKSKEDEMEPTLKCLRFDEVIQQTGLSRSTINRHRVSGAFPEPLRVGGVLLWRQADLIEWLDNLSSQTGEVAHD